jgi:hypothetical protein
MRDVALAVAVAALFALVAGEAFARGGMGQGNRGNCMNGSQMQTRQQLRDGSCMNGGTPRQGGGQGQMRRMGPADGTGAAPKPQDGTGYGAPAFPPATTTESGK